MATAEDLKVKIRATLDLFPVTQQLRAMADVLENQARYLRQSADDLDAQERLLEEEVDKSSQSE